MDEYYTNIHIPRKQNNLYSEISPELRKSLSGQEIYNLLHSHAGTIYSEGITLYQIQYAQYIVDKVKRGFITKEELLPLLEKSERNDQRLVFIEHGKNCLIEFIENNEYTREEEYWSTGGRTGTLPDRITPCRIHGLMPHEVYVFGSNKSGHHTMGSAAHALNKFGAKMGVSEGLQGNSYAIPTTGTLEEVEAAVKLFTEFAKAHQELNFFITKVGCGKAGHTKEQIAPLFYEAAHFKNIFLPISFWEVIK